MIGYTTLEEAKEYLANRFDYNISDDVLKKALYQAIDKIENINIRNSGRSKTQELNFPRIGEETVPKDIKAAQALEAFSLATTGNDTIDDMEKGITARSIGDMVISYGQDAKNKIGDIFFLS